MFALLSLRYCVCVFVCVCVCVCVCVLFVLHVAFLKKNVTASMQHQGDFGLSATLKEFENGFHADQVSTKVAARECVGVG